MILNIMSTEQIVRLDKRTKVKLDLQNDFLKLYNEYIVNRK